jgi:hypothetical protein
VPLWPSRWPLAPLLSLSLPACCGSCVLAQQQLAWWLAQAAWAECGLETMRGSSRGFMLRGWPPLPRRTTLVGVFGPRMIG